MDQVATQTGQVVQKMIEHPTEAWIALLPILFIGLLFYTMYQNGKREQEMRQDSKQREEKFFEVMTNHGDRMGDLSNVVSKQTETLVVIKDEVCRVRDEVDDIKSFLNWKEGKAS
jgi:hypothetical protein